MKKDYILATDYKSSFFSAVFSFETSESVFNSLDKYDLLHSYMVCEIIQKFESVADKDINRPFAVENVLAQIRQIVKNIKKSGAGPSPDKKLRESLEKIKKKYPVECKQIDKMLEDESGIVFCSFFVPQVISDLLKEFDIVNYSNPKKKKCLIHVDLNTQFVNTDIQSVSLMYDAAYDTITKEDLSDHDQQYIEKSKELLKTSIELYMVSNGHLDQHMSKYHKNSLEEEQ